MRSRTFRPTAELPPGSTIATGPGGLSYVVIRSEGGLEVFVEVLDAFARGWLEEVTPARPRFSDCSGFIPGF